MRHYKNIHFLGGFSLANKKGGVKYLYRYLNTRRALETLDNEKLAFLNPILWKDPYEKRFITANFHGANFKIPKVYCMCATLKSTNEAAWKMYADEKKKGSRCLKFTLITSYFLDILDKLTDYEVYIGKVNYSMTTNQIKGLHRKGTPLFSQYFSNFNLEKYLKLLLIKRKAFEYEEEIRVFLVPKTGVNTSKDVCLLDIFSKSLFESITIDPNCSEKERKDLKTQLSKKYSMRCLRSTLYKELEDKVVVDLK